MSVITRFECKKIISNAYIITRMRSIKGINKLIYQIIAIRKIRIRYGTNRKCNDLFQCLVINLCRKINIKMPERLTAVGDLKGNIRIIPSSTTVNAKLIKLSVVRLNNLAK